LGQTAKSENFSTRISPETRQALEREAADSGRSISQVAERLLNSAIQEKRRRQAQPSMRAISFLIEQVALRLVEQNVVCINFADHDPNVLESADGREMLKAVAEGDVGLEAWRTNPFLYQAFKLAVASLLSLFDPKGELRSPIPIDLVSKVSAVKNDPGLLEHMTRIWSSPENLAAHVVTYIRLGLGRNHALFKQELEAVAPYDDLIRSIKDEFYGMQQVRRDLGLESRKTEK
jgi:hypothetical protein